VTSGPRSPELVNAYIEIGPTDAVKYELDKWSGHLRVDRPQRFSSMSPTLYGFIPQTYCGREVAELCELRTGRSGMEGDKDPMDICVLSEKTFGNGGFFLHARPIGGLRMIDGNQADDKIIAVLENDLAYSQMMEVRDVPQGLVDRLKHYFLSYKQLPSDQEKKVEIVDVYDRIEAMDVITRSLRDYEGEFGTA
jgi:inorganic pyrophosphatase